MMRSNPASSMQKTYDECYLTCSTAVYFESQNNEAEALRSWKSALDQINYHNAYRVSSSYVPRTETEKALFESLKQMEMQCRERVDLLEALKQSRKEAGKETLEPTGYSRRINSRTPSQPGNWLGDQTVPPAQYSDIPSSSPSLPPRPPVTSRVSSNSVQEKPVPEIRRPSSLGQPPQLPVPIQQKSRSPSPDNGRKAMRKTLRPEGRTPKQKATYTRTSRPAPMKAAGLAWDTHPRANSVASTRPESDLSIEARLSATAARRSLDQPRTEEDKDGNYVKMPDPTDFIPVSHFRDASSSSPTPPLSTKVDKMTLSPTYNKASTGSAQPAAPFTSRLPPPPPPHGKAFSTSKPETPSRLTKPPEITYRKEYLPATSKVAPSVANSILEKAYNQKASDDQPASGVTRKPVAAPSPPQSRYIGSKPGVASDSDERSVLRDRRPVQREQSAEELTPPSTDADSTEGEISEAAQWEQKVQNIMKNLPKGLDELAAKNILNEIVVKGDEVHWDDVAGLHAAKKALKEAVVYPFLRPDLFSGLREPARGMLLFGPPGTGKTMLARAVATESKSTFFAISASSLTSKWHGESEKLVRALFGLAKALAPSIIFVDEIDSLLNSRGGNEHEASRRSKTEFLIQWSDLQRAAAGKDTGIGDASRVLVLAATNCPWDIDEAARRRFVRRQYIPLPEDETRETQLRTLLAAQKHDLKDRDIQRLVKWTDGYSGSDITALAKDAAMGPLRNLGEALLFTPMEKIRPICMADFQASLESIRPSVSKKGLEEFDEWAREYGERGG